MEELTRLQASRRGHRGHLTEVTEEVGGESCSSKWHDRSHSHVRKKHTGSTVKEVGNTQNSGHSDSTKTKWGWRFGKRYCKGRKRKLSKPSLIELGVIIDSGITISPPTPSSSSLPATASVTPAFHVFLWILWDSVDLLEFCSSVTTWNIRSHIYDWTQLTESNKKPAHHQIYLDSLMKSSF